MRKVILLLLILSLKLSLGQAQTSTEKPIDPNLPPPLLPVPETNATQAPTLNLGNTPSGFYPVAPPEVAFNNRFKDIPVNLYTGTPIVNFPLYNLSEAGISVPISLNYNSSGMKAHEVATWCGMGWALNAGGMITRVVQDVPDEGKLELTNINSNTFNHLKGYYRYGYSTFQDTHDHEPDIYYLNIGGTSYKFMFQSGKGFTFFPDADIEVQMQTQVLSSSSGINVYEVTKWVVTMPDGMIYEFSGAVEKSAEIEVKYAQSNGITPWNSKFQRYWKTNGVVSAWYLSKIISPHGHEINFNYTSSSYSYYRLAENEADGVCPQPANVEKKINHVYVNTSSISQITSRTVKVEFNKADLVCTYNPETGMEECNLNSDRIPSRKDIDSYYGSPSGQSNAKKLVEMTIMDNVTTPIDTLKYTFEYDHFISADSTDSYLPSPYTISDVGKSHTRRLRLKQINLPDKTNTKFSYYYENAPTTFYSRLTYGVDHWGFLNGSISNGGATGLIPKDYHFPSCTPYTSNRDTDSLYAKYGLIEKITSSTGSEITFDYEAHKAENYKNGINYIPIGGSRIKQINQKDLISGIETIKKYIYRTEDSTKSSGFLLIKPIYRFHKNTTPYVNSGLYDFLLNQSGRPAVAYSHVTEKITTNSNENLGFTSYDFDMDTSESTIKTVINCTSTCDTVFRAELFLPDHDYEGGTPLRTRIYNNERKVISEQRNTHYLSGYDYFYSTSGHRVIRFNNQFIASSMVVYFRKYRPKKVESIIYSQEGTNPVATTTQYFYKDEMNGAYQAKYKGKHNFVVRTDLTDTDGYTHQTWNKYVADYLFDKDTTVCDENNGNCTTQLLIQPNTDADAIYEMRVKHLLSSIVESYSFKLGYENAIYNSYRSFPNIASPFKYNLKETFSTDSVGKGIFMDAYYNINQRDIKKDLSYYSAVQYQDYNPIGLPLKIKPLGGAVSKIVYDPLNVLPLQQIQNDGGVTQLQTSNEFDVKMFGVSKQISPNSLEVRHKYYPDGRPKQSEDKDGFILSHFDYRYKGETLINSFGSFTTDTSKNRVIVHSPRVATTNPYQDIDSVTTTVSYNDGVGRGLQSVGYKVSPNKRDIVSNINVFDNFGRPLKNILPVGNITGNGNFQTNLLPLAKAFYDNDSIPFTQIKQYEGSPLSRVFKSYGAGKEFRPNVYAEQKFETGNYSARRYIYDNNSDLLEISFYYTGNQLVREITTDERGNKTRIVTDKLGRLIEKHVQYTGDGTQEGHYLKTGYAYDKLGRLAVIIPPKIYESNTSTINASNSLYTKGLYIFKYDHRGRVIAKHTPDAGWSYLVYNQQNQVVMSQNARHRQDSLWLYSKSDAFGRNIISGVIRLNKTQDTLQKYFDLYNEVNQYEETTQTVFNGTASCYTNRSFPSQISLPDSSIMAVNFFDDYSWKTNDTLTFKLYSKAKYENAKGLLTGNVVRNLKTKQFLRTALYYDDNNRLIQSQNENRYGLVTQSDNVFDFIGQLLEYRTIYRKPSQPDVISKTKYLYDHVGRKIQTIHQLNNNPPEILASHEYDEIGRMVVKNLNEAKKDSIIRANESLNRGITDVAKKYILLQPGTLINPDSTYYAFIGSGFQKINFKYNIRGNLRGINLTPQGGLDSSKVFSLKLDYYEDGRYLDGNLSKQQWKTSRDTTTRKFVYDYDKVNRITGAAFTGKGNEDYSLSNLSYDTNGNIKTLNRKGFVSSGNWNTIDNLSYTYINPFTAPNDVSNRLYQVQDAIGTTVGIGDFKNGSNSIDEYLYYADGSLKTDLNKGIDSIKYNYLGLQTHVYFDPDKYIENIYTADGVKLSQRIVNGTSVIQTDYSGNLLYRNDTLVTVWHDEGKIRFDTLGKTHYQFFITDHLGNTRVIFEKLNDSVYIAQENHYGAWGELLQGLGTGSDWKFLFQGKEYIDAFGYNSYDFTTRQYDQNLGRMWQVDGANQFASGYTGMGNMPTMGVDPDGQFWQYVAAAAVGGTINLVSNWSKIKGTGLKGFVHGAAYFTSGAVGGMVSIHNVAAGGAITSGGNAFIDIATGNVPTIKNFGDAAKYVGVEAIKGVVTSYIGGQVGKYVGPKLNSLFGWAQQGFSQYAPGVEKIGNEVVEWAYEGGVKASYGKLGGAVGGVVGKQAANKAIVPLTEETFNQALYSGAEKIGNYSIYGTKGMVGNTFNRNIFLLEADKGTKGLSNLRNLIGSFESEALNSGADKISIYGSSVINKGFLNPNIASRFGYTFEQSGSGIFLQKILIK